MPKPEDVNPMNYEIHRILFNDGEFLLAWGKWIEDGTMRVAMRWNGEGDEPGYPSLFRNAVWFQLPESVSLEITRSLIGATGAKNPELLSLLSEFVE